MTTKDTVLMLGLSALFASSTPSRLQPQSEPADCRIFASRLRSDRATASEVMTLGGCPQSGPAALGEAWTRSFPQTHEHWSALVEATATLRDDRPFAAAASVTTAPNAAPMDRIRALQVLARYFDPRLAPSIEFLTTGTVGSPIPRRFDDVAIEGASPLRPSAPAEIARVLAQLSTTERDRTVRGAARRLRQSLALSHPRQTPLQAGSIALIAGCGSRVTLRSIAEIDVVVNLRVDGDGKPGFSRDYVIGAGATSKPTDRLLSLPRGAVVATFGGHEVARLSERNAPCTPGIVNW